MRIRNFAAAAILGVAALGLSGCATGLPTKVTRYSTAIPQGQSFYVVPAQGIQPGLEFNSYAGIVAQQLAARGYRQAPSTAAADMLVKVGYGVDEGRQEVYVDPVARDPFFYGGYYGRPYFSRYGYYGGYRSPFYWGWNDPFWYGGGVDSYVEYHSQVDLHIRAARTNQPLFDGRAQARSQTNRLDVLVPSLVEALFTGFPGRSGEVVKITVPKPPRG